jgi:predicted nucleic acid-binding protein
VIYLDSAAIVKMVREEKETAALITWLNQHTGDQLVSSALAEVEVPRALRRSEPRVLGAVAGTLARLVRIEIDPAIRATAAAYQDPMLRSLDAVHLATADQLIASGGSVRAFVTYDKRLAEAADAAGLIVAAPGQDS